MAAPPSNTSDALHSRSWDQLWRLLTRPIPDDSPASLPSPTLDDEPTDDDGAASAA